MTHIRLGVSATSGKTVIIYTIHTSTESEKETARLWKLDSSHHTKPIPETLATVSSTVIRI